MEPAKYIVRYRVVFAINGIYLFNIDLDFLYSYMQFSNTIQPTFVCYSHWTWSPASESWLYYKVDSENKEQGKI